MTQEEPNTVRAESSARPDLMPPEFMSMGKKRIKELAEMQTELFEKLQEANRGWLERMQTETNLASEFGAKLTEAHSVTETVAACREWASRRIEMATEDAKHLLSDTQTFMETGTRLLSRGWPSSGAGGGKSAPSTPGQFTALVRTLVKQKSVPIEGVEHGRDSAGCFHLEQDGVGAGCRSLCWR